MCGAAFLCLSGDFFEGGGIIGRITWVNYRGETHGLKSEHNTRFYPYIYRFQNACQPTIYVRGMSGGVAPIPTFCPYRARYLLNPGHEGTQGVVHSVHFTLG